jgi:hypothetical protein
MIDIKINIDGEENNFTIPESWSEVTVDQSARLYSLDRENKNEIQLIVEVVNIFSSIDEEIIYMLTPDQFGQLVETIKFINTEIKSELSDSIKIGDEEYFLKKDFQSLTMGEIISIETIMKGYGDNLPGAMAKLLCIFLRKKKENGNLETFKNSFMEREEMFKNVIITDVNNIFLFFLDGSNSSDNNMKDCSEKKEE